MAIKYRMTLEKIPEVDSSADLREEGRNHQIESPEGYGWHLEYSFKGDYNVYHIWKKGGTKFDHGYENTWTGKADNLETGEVGEGEQLIVKTKVGESTAHIDVSFIPGETYIYGGEATWGNATIGDAISLQAIASATAVTTESTDLNLILDGDKVVPVTSNGTHAFAGIPTIVDNKTQTGCWDIQNGAVVPNYAGTGMVDIFTSEKVVAKLLNHVPVAPAENGYTSVKTENAWKILPGYKFRYIAHNNSDTEWYVCFFMHMIRRSTATY